MDQPLDGRGAHMGMGWPAAGRGPLDHVDLGVRLIECFGVVPVHRLAGQDRVGLVESVRMALARSTAVAIRGDCRPVVRSKQTYR